MLRTIHVEGSCAGYTGNFNRVSSSVFDFGSEDDELVAVFLVFEFVLGRREHFLRAKLGKVVKIFD